MTSSCLMHLCIKCNMYLKYIHDSALNLIGVIWSGDDIERSVCLLFVIFAHS